MKLCSVCLIEPDIDYLECLHVICKKCFYKLAEDNISSMKCQNCQAEICYSYKKDYLGKDFFVLEDLAFKKLIKENIIICANLTCKELIAFEKGNVDYTVKNEKGEFLLKIAAEHYTSNRCRCPACKIDFCVTCKSTPYHMGKYTHVLIRFYM